jgi:hypothetical protein
MSKFYVDAIGGENTNNGTLQDPFATLDKALEAVGLATGDGHIIYMLEGVYKGGNYENSKNGTKIIGIGNVLLDCSGYSGCFITKGFTDLIVSNIKVSGFSRYFLDVNFDAPEHSDIITLTNCTIFQSGALYSQTYLIDRALGVLKAFKLNFINSTIWGIKIDSYFSNSLSNDGYYCFWTNCIVVKGYFDSDASYTSNVEACASDNSHLYNASRGINTNTFAIPVYSEDANTPDLRFDKDHVNYHKYVSNSAEESPTGNPSRDIRSWASSAIDGTGISSNQMLGSFENDTNTYDPSWQDVVIGTGNCKIDFNEGSGELTATLTNKTYTSGDELAAEIQTQLNTEGSETYVVTFSNTQRIVIGSEGDELELLWNTGTNSANTAGTALKFDVSSDDTAQTTYTADDPLTKGGLAGATDVTVIDDQAYLNLNLKADATFGCIVSPVVDNIVPKTLERVFLGSISEGDSVVDSTPFQTITVGSGNCKIDFDEGSGELTATLTLGDYASGASIASEMQTQLNAEGANTYTVVYTDQHYIKITSSGSFSLLWSTGTNSSDSVASDIGFDSTDLSGALEYEAQSPLASGRTIQVRGNNIVFDSQAPSASTTLDWTTLQVDGYETVSYKYRFMQYKVFLRREA